ncbi:hypothetical protein J2801_004903 [Paraburkholderia phenoliruptrix]|uniref:hypothetical protein n=1 Tax=Paraburkholderia phenoliruptrix TaxID=252970 RepID=UPI002859621F|nr:hypothetical protein [Paraburkholderia phenoliruptrix]MDR6422611.1 hypothetical protein [Paraburkholderia phenoliruptrix]
MLIAFFLVAPVAILGLIWIASKIDPKTGRWNETSRFPSFHKTLYNVVVMPPFDKSHFASSRSEIATELMTITSRLHSKTAQDDVSEIRQPPGFPVMKK